MKYLQMFVMFFNVNMQRLRQEELVNRYLYSTLLHFMENNKQQIGMHEQKI